MDTFFKPFKLVEDILSDQRDFKVSGIFELSIIFTFDYEVFNPNITNLENLRINVEASCFTCASYCITMENE